MKTLLIIASLALTCCYDVGPSKTSDSGGGTYISNGDASATLYIVEKDGYKFAVLIGPSKGAIVQLKD